MPSASRDKRITSPKERIIPIEIEGNKSKTKAKPIVIRHDHSDSSDAESVIVRDTVSVNTNAKKLNDGWEVKVVEPKQKKSKDVKKNSKKESKKVDTKKDINKANVDINENPVENKKKNVKSKDKNPDKSVNDPKRSKEKKTVDHEISNVTITTQPGKSILKHPIASSTPIPEADYDSSWANRSSVSTGTVVKKPASKKSKCWSWFCLPCSLCCACAPFEIECCHCCELRCTRCEQCFFSCCHRKCC